MALAVYRRGLVVFLAAGVVQIFPAGPGTFRLLNGAGDSAFDPHRMLGFAMAGIAFIILILALIARPGARAIAAAVLLVLLTSFVGMWVLDPACVPATSAGTKDPHTGDFWPCTTCFHRDGSRVKGSVLDEAHHAH